ncbi:MAG: SMI1/KNR4 family protein [Aulosira sp. ZfuVER01]|nr:SMI1/KNR4 family protein [Aulosira sp. ZfuVER01]MDZ7997034.1 SMI1/KNR4 family protein [Aulosira sp. DedVER01a]MDZ8053063.1 SMI1/KNR4 family protein [Aulosira sp. ZfuCHP01]
MSKLTETLDKILNWLEEHEDLDFARFESLQPGLTYKEIEQKLTDLLPLRLPKEVYELYQWGNGAWYDEEDWARFFDNRTFLSLESALDMYFGLTKLDKEADKLEFPSMWSDTWNTRWFPIFQEQYNTGFYAVVLDEAQKETTPVLDIFLEDCDDEPFIIYPSITKMILAEAELYESGYYLQKAELKQLSYDLQSRYRSALDEEAKYIRQKYQDMHIKVWRQ